MGISRSFALLLAPFVLALLSCSKSEPVKAGRPQLQVGGMSWRIVSGNWKKEGDTLVGSGGHIQSVTDLSDGTLEMDVEERGASSYYTVGLGFRYTLFDDQQSRASGYTLNLQGHGFNVFRGANDYWLPVNPDTKGFIKSSIIDPKKNHVIIRMKGSSFEFEVNGAPLINLSDDAYAHGHVNLWVETAEQTVVFSNIQVKG